MKPILEIQNISKKFRINHEQQAYLSLRDSLSNFFKRKSFTEDFFALQNVNFNVDPGDTIGIIGKNGAGKSTLLKILSKITPPTSGKIICRGRIASLLEVGTGFHPELSGKENVFMNGSILGMRSAEIQKNFDAIVDFAGVEKFIDTPLKHYSSGMQLRLAFAVAAFLENEILIIDEVLAVGDAEFQKKCMGKMEDASKSGRTILFVSHNVAAVQRLCKKAVFLQQGRVFSQGNSEDVINTYNSSQINSTEIKLFRHKNVWFSGFDYFSSKQFLNKAYSFKPLTFVISFESKLKFEDAYIGIGINDYSGARIFTLFSKFTNQKFDINPGINKINCSIDKLMLKPGNYFVEIYLGNGKDVYDYYDHGLIFEVLHSELLKYEMIPDSTQGSIIVNQSWEISNH